MQAKKELTRRQEAALLALMDGTNLSLVEVARKISVHESTLWRWMHRDEAFMRAYRDLRRVAVEHGVARLQGLLAKAIETLERNLDTGNRPAEVRTAATIIRQAVEGVDVWDTEQRLSAVEEKLQLRKGGQHG
ncbi:MAG TPA: phBC6A51 family helix-turn-helix protein [Pyrinomonadaceae bacterium]